MSISDCEWRISRKPEIVCIIPARSGSKRLKGKNKKMFLDKPLICWTIDLALKVDYFDRIIVSTDDIDILQMCLKKYDNFDKLYLLQRSEKLSSDSTPMWKVIKDIFMLSLINRRTIIVILQVTSPLRLKEDIEIPISMFLKNNIGVVSICKKDEITYKRNGAIYIDWYNNWIKNKDVDGQYYLMPPERSVDIDVLEDFELAENLMKKMKTFILKEK